MEMTRNSYKMLVERTQRKRPLEDLFMDGTILFEWILG